MEQLFNETRNIGHFEHPYGSKVHIVSFEARVTAHYDAPLKVFMAECIWIRRGWLFEMPDGIVPERRYLLTLRTNEEAVRETVRIADQWKDYVETVIIPAHKEYIIGVED